MLGIIVSGHGEFASSFEKTVEYVIGTQEKIKYINFNNQISKAELNSRFKEAMDSLSLEEGILFVTDLLGGTPFSVAVELSLENKDNIKVIGGTNLPALLAAIELREEYENPLNYIEEIIEEGKEAIAMFSQNEDVDNTEDLGEGI